MSKRPRPSLTVTFRGRPVPGGHILLALLPFVLVVAAAVLLHHAPSDLLEASLPPRETEILPLAPATPAPEAPPAAQAPAPEQGLMAETVKDGDTADTILGNLLTPAEIHALAVACKDAFPLSRLRAGQPYRIQTENGLFAGFEYEIDRDRLLVVRRYQDRLVPAVLPIEYEVRTQTVAATIQGNLFDTVSGLGEHTDLAIRIADVFAWDIDFCRDIQPGDSFRVVVEKKYRDGKFVCYGKMPVAEFTNQGQAYRGFLFENGKNGLAYFDQTGRCLKKAFLMAPLSFVRITSGFTHKRLHPILRYYRPHTGVDYAAPVGTPVWSVGEGTVASAGYNAEAGKFVVVRHNGNLRTQYNHLRDFGRGVRAGASVSQGQTIGYVGMTGLTTGPHLDFRMYQGNTPVNPRMLRGSASTDPVPAARLAQFQKTAQDLAVLLESAPDRSGPAAQAQAAAVQAAQGLQEPASRE